MDDCELITRAEANLSGLYQRNSGFAKFIRDQINHGGFIVLASRREIEARSFGSGNPYLYLNIDPAGSARLIFRSYVGAALMQCDANHSWEELGKKFDKKYQKAFKKIIEKLAGSEGDVVNFFERRYKRKIKNHAIVVIQEPKIIKGTELAVVAVRREGAKREVDPYTDPSLQKDLSVLHAIVPASLVINFKVGQRVRLHYFEHEGITMCSVSTISDNG
jgi:hypothetical protein